ncbi:MAG: thermonuclease family protein [Cyanobacteriota bacterium]
MTSATMQTPAMTRRFLVLLLSLWTIVPSSPVTAQSLRATVASIGDGDTIRVRQNGRAITVRLACIDAPETAQSPFGQQARSFLQQQLPIGREVTIDIRTSDRYGRSVAEVIAGNNINLMMVEEGQAFAYRRYLGGCDAGNYLSAELQASRRRHGVWQVPGGITRPWEFRQGRRSLVVRDGSTPGGHRYRCREISSYAQAQTLLRQGHTYLDGNGDGEACESLR